MRTAALWSRMRRRLRTRAMRSVFAKRCLPMNITLALETRPADSIAVIALSRCGIRMRIGFRNRRTRSTKAFRSSLRIARARLLARCSITHGARVSISARSRQTSIRSVLSMVQSITISSWVHPRAKWWRLMHGSPASLLCLRCGLWVFSSRATRTRLRAG